MNPGVGQGLSNFVNNYQSAANANDEAELRRLQIDQMKKSIATQDQQSLLNLANQAKADKVKTPASFDDQGNPLDEDGNIIAPNNGVAKAPPPVPTQQQTPNPGQASVPMVQQGQQPPPVQQQPQMQGGQRPPVPGMMGGGQPQAMTPQPPQAPMQRQPIPPYQSMNRLQSNQPQMPQQVGQQGQGQGMSLPQIQTVQFLKSADQQGKKDASMWDDYVKLVSSPPKTTPTENKMKYYMSQGLTSQQALQYKLGMTPKEYETAVREERSNQETERKNRADEIEKMITAQQRGKKDDAEISHWSSEDKAKISELALQREKFNRQKSDDDSETALASGALFREGKASNYNMKQNAKAVAETHKKYPNMTLDEIVDKGQQAKELNAERQSQMILQGKVSGFEKTVIGNLDQIMNEIDAQRKAGKTDVPALNALLTKYNSMTGEAYQQGVELFGREASSELAKLASSASGAGSGGTVQDREEWNSFFKPNGSYAQMKKSVDAAKTATQIRIKSSKDSINETNQQIRDLWPDTVGDKSSSSSQGLPDGWSVKVH